MSPQHQTNSQLLSGIILTGLLGFLIHPFVINGYQFTDLGFLAWIYLIPLILVIRDLTFRKKLFFSFITCLTTQYGLVYWLMTAMNGFGGLNTLEAFGVLTAFSLVFGFLLAIFIVGAIETSQKIKLPIALTLPLFMVTHDVLIHHFPFGGYPWGIVPYSQGNWIQYFQWVDHTGIFGLSLLVYLVNGLLTDLILGIGQKSSKKIISCLTFVILVGILSIISSQKALSRYEQNRKSLGELSLALIQGNISQDLKWNARQAKTNLFQHLDLTKLAVNGGAPLIIWPETAYTYGLKEKQIGTEKFLPGANLNIPLLFGSITGSLKNGRQELFNSVIQTNNQGDMISIYRKQHLVPFGEYLPFAQYLKFMKSLTQGVGEMSAGSDYVLFDSNGFKLAPLICIEDIFPEYAREFTKKGAQVLINFTNDAWYGDSSAQHQHLVYSQFRALENRLPVLRATNTGVTAVISPAGQIMQTLKPFKADILSVNMTIQQYQSYYSSHGDKWLWIIYIAFAILLSGTIIKTILITTRAKNCPHRR